MADKDSVTPLITSHNPEVINNRFVVQYSVMNNGVTPKSYMLVIIDLVEEGFTIKYFSNTDDVVSILKLLKAT